MGHTPLQSSRTARSVLRSSTLVLATLTMTTAILVSCGGEDAATTDDEPTTSTTTSTTTTESTTTTAAPRADADPATQELARAATLQTADFGAGWIEYGPGEPFTPTDDSCGYREGGPEDALLAGATMSGPTVQLGDQPAFVSSRSFVFSSEAEAQAWVEIASSDEWADCVMAQVQANQDEAEADVTLRLDSREAESLGQSGFEAFASFVGENGDGEVVYAWQSSVYRLGRTVIVTNSEDGGLGEDTAAFTEGDYAALSAAYARVNALEPR